MSSDLANLLTDVDPDDFCEVPVEDILLANLRRRLEAAHERENRAEERTRAARARIQAAEERVQAQIQAAQADEQKAMKFLSQAMSYNTILIGASICESSTFEIASYVLIFRGFSDKRWFHRPSK